MRSIETVLSAVPAFAAGGQSEVPEPDTIALLTLATAGIVIGRRWSVKRPPEN
jgi:hypothetical protein